MKKYSLFFIILLLVLLGCSNNDDHEEADKPKPHVESEVIKNIEVSTIAGDQIEGQFSQLAGVTHDQKGNLYVSDAQNHLIYRIDDRGAAEVIAGYSDEVDGFNQPVGDFQDGPLAEAQFNFPIGLAIDSENNLYIADSGNGAIRKLTEAGEVVTVVQGLVYPFDIVITDADELFFSDALSHQIYRITSTGRLEVFAGGGYVEEDGYLVGAYQDGQGETAQFNEPSGLAFTPSGDLLVADSGNQRIRVIQPDGTVSTVAGSGDVFIPGTPYINGGYRDGMVDEAQFNFPKGIIALSENELIIADTYNHVLRLIQDGEVTTLVGTGNAGFYDGSQSTAQFYNPNMMTYIDNKLILADQYNRAVREVQFTKE